MDRGRGGLGPNRGGRGGGGVQPPVGQDPPRGSTWLKALMQSSGQIAVPELKPNDPKMGGLMASAPQGGVMPWEELESTDPRLKGVLLLRVDSRKNGTAYQEALSQLPNGYFISAHFTCRVGDSDFIAVDEFTNVKYPFPFSQQKRAVRMVSGALGVTVQLIEENSVNSIINELLCSNYLQVAGPCPLEVALSGNLKNVQWPAFEYFKKLTGADFVLHPNDWLETLIY